MSAAAEQALGPYETSLSEGVQHFLAGRFEESKQAFKHTIELNPKRPEAYQQLMIACEQRADVDGLIDAVVRWLTVAPTDMRATQELVNLCLNNRRFAPAIDQLKLLLRTDPDNESLLNLICLLFIESKRYHDGLPYFERVFELHPQQSPQVVKAFAWVLYQSHQFSRALALAQTVAGLLADDEEIYVLLASCHLALGQLSSHRDVYERAFARLPENKTIECSLALAQFMTSNMREGFKHYDSRWHSAWCTPRCFDLPYWQGQPLAGKHLLLWAEQGVGDVTMFATLLPWLAGQGAAHIRFGCEAKMVPLMQRSFPWLECMNYDDATFAQLPQGFDYHAPMGELMRYSLPAYVPAQHDAVYVPDAALKRELRTRYEAAAAARGARKIIGIAWHTKNDLNNLLRNIALEQWAPLFAIPQVQYVSLQYGNHAADIATIASQFPGALLVDAQVDAFASTEAAIAQVAAMDEIITIQNATAHFGGACGVPTHLLLSVASDWRWGAQRTDALWYKSVTVHRQHEALNWQPLMQQMADRLRSEG